MVVFRSGDMPDGVHHVLAHLSTMCPVHTLRQKKVTKEKATHCLRPLRCATGQPAVLAFRGVSQNSLRCAALRQLRALIRETLRSSAQPEGVGRAIAMLGPADPSGLCFARPQWKIQGLCMRTHHTRTRQGALTLIPSGCAEERRGKRDKGRSCLSGTKCSEFCGPPLSPSTAGCPQRSGGTQTAGSPSLWLLSLGETRESDSPAGARPGQQPQQKRSKKINARASHPHRQPT